ncbi:flavin reductase [Dactylosporangium aurantiacum]|uniref:Flavin reductase n=1 Tax=Dactylosporangium aurantiacum TaxID=35754 RepID=A0A9Q9MAH8_9ACTN|nr:flavin reductase [Dactylosporangium aurantiacum]MDG6103648.1 flavin reductase [Dactylosporangium aurantiacum]UWZ51863.1 flavin reductase [Dactylosporangium aurantiacum]
MTIDPDTFRSVLAQWPSGVSVVTTVAGDGWHGMTASSFSSVSVDPPLILVCLNRRITTHALIEASGVFAVSVLAKDQTVIGRRFAGQERVADRFAGGAWQTRVTGAPVLTDAVGWLDCRVVHAYAGGDHTIFVGAVLGAATERVVAPLLFHSRAWGQLADVLPDAVGVADSGLLSALRHHAVPAGAAGTLATALRAAGVRVRVRDPHGCLTSAGDRRTATALVATADEVADAALGGAGVLELPAGDTSGGAAGTRHILEEARRYDMTAACWLPDAFAPARAGEVLAAVDALAALGCDEIGLDEGAEAASPRQVRALLQDATVRASTSPRPVSLRVRLRDRHGLGLVNALTAMKSGVRHFDTTLGGIDGVLACEDVQFLADRLGVACDSPRAALVAAAADLERHLGGALPGRTYRVPIS